MLNSACHLSTDQATLVDDTLQSDNDLPLRIKTAAKLFKTINKHSNDANQLPSFAAFVSFSLHLTCGKLELSPAGGIDESVCIRRQT